MRRAPWLLPCWVACTSATPPPEASRAANEVAPAPAPAAEVPLCEPGATRSCYPGPEGTAGVGRCTAGAETCEAAGWGPCTGAVVPAVTEDCSAPDDEDCDGRSTDCSEVAGTFAIAFTRDAKLWLEDWGGGLGIVADPLFWVVEPGGRVVDVWEEAEPGDDPTWERDPDSGEAQTIETGGAWPGALVRAYETAATRAGSMIAQEQWDGAMFSSVVNTDDYLQWRYYDAQPWRDGHAIARREWSSSFDTMEALDESTLEFGGIEAAEQRALRRKVDRLLARAEPRLVIVAAADVAAWEASYELFAAGGGTVTQAGDEPEPAAEAVANEDAPTAELPQPPVLPGEPDGFTVLSDGTVVMLVDDALRSWKPKQRRWAAIEAPSGTLVRSKAALHAGPDGELLLCDEPADASASTLWRRSGSTWSAVPLPTRACPDALATGPDRTRWIIAGEALLQRRPGDAGAWRRVTLPAPWRPRDVVVFDGRVWIAAEAEGGRWAVLVDRAVPSPRVLPTR